MRLSSPCPHDRIRVRSAGTAARRGGRPAAALAAAVDRRAHQPRRRLERAPPLVLADVARAAATARARASHSASASHMFPIPATSDWSSSASPNQRVAVRRAQPREHRVDARRPLEDVRAEPARARGCAARAPGRSRGPPPPARRAARATACRARARRAGARVQRPDMRRCDRSDDAALEAEQRGSCRAPSPTRAPCRRSARRRAPACARGCGDSASTRWPTSACRRRAARWRVSPSGTFPTVASVGDCVSRVSVVIPSLNIAALTQRTGVPQDTIRKWEQRYGVLHPERTAGGQRRYSELDVARVEWLKARLARGVPDRRGGGAARRRESRPALRRRSCVTRSSTPRCGPTSTRLGNLVEQALRALIAARGVLRGARARARSRSACAGRPATSRRAGAPRDVDRARRDAAAARGCARRRARRRRPRVRARRAARDRAC